jgi:peptidoglycan hydrolase CwlO-like protein
MNLSTGQAASRGGDNNNSGGGGALRGTFDAAPANSLIVGAVGFGPAWNDEPSLRELYDTACASIVRAECEADELRAEVAMLQEQAQIISQERDEARVQYRSVNALAEALVKTIGELKAERVELRDTVLKLRRERAAQDAVIATYRDEACRESCRDKAAADGGWSNI